MTDQQEPAVHRQPWLHELCICVDGNATALSCASGDIRPGTAEGFYVDDVRALSSLRVTVSGEAPSPVSHGASGSRAEFFLSARNLGNPGADPTVEVRRVARGIDLEGLARLHQAPGGQDRRGKEHPW